jgi:plasmid stability protein
MANLTITLSDDVIRRARVRAVEQGTSVNALVAAYLERYAGPDPAREATAAFLELADTTAAGSGGGGRTWTRDELYDRPNVR